MIIFKNKHYLSLAREGSDKKIVTLTLLVVVLKKENNSKFHESLTELFKIKQRNFVFGGGRIRAYHKMF